jgi:hypothetical protein
VRTLELTTVTTNPQSSGPLTAEHRQQLALAADRANPVRKAARVAAFNAWITGIIAALSLPFALFSVAGFLVAAGLAVVAWNEFRGHRRLLNFDSSAARMLSWNQIGFLVMIVVYCAWAIYSGLTSENLFAKELAANPDLSALGLGKDFDAMFKDVYKLCVLGFYGTVIILSVIFQGATAIYYATRRKYVERYVAETPEWIRELQRANLPA